VSPQQLEPAWGILLRGNRFVGQREFELLAAVLFQDVAGARRLLSIDAFSQTPSVQNSLLWDCLTWAAYQGDNRMVTLLLEAGVTPTLEKYSTFVECPEDERSYSKPCLSLATASARKIILEQWPELGNQDG